jgi:hypothetical protein
MANLLHIKDVVMDHIVRTDDQRISSFFSAAGHGHVQKVRIMLSQGQELDPNTVDYDGEQGSAAAWQPGS